MFKLKTENGNHIVRTNRGVWVFKELSGALRFIWLTSGKMTLDGRKLVVRRVGRILRYAYER